MICTQRDNHIRKLIMEDISMTWKCTLDDDTIVWGDYERPGVEESPWLRLQEYCEENGRCVCKAQVIVMGAPEEIVFPSYQHMTFGILKDDLQHVEVKKYSWPECSFVDFAQVRKTTQENLSYMIWKDGSEKKQSEQVQITLNG